MVNPRSPRYLLGVALTFLIIGVGIGWFLSTYSRDTFNYPSGRVCTDEAKVCPDGTVIGRTGANCEFAPCPTVKLNPQKQMTDWKTYTNNTSKLVFRYPEKLFVYQGNPQTDGQYWSNQKNGTNPAALGPDGVWMSFNVASPSPQLFSRYEKILNIKEGATIPEQAILKIIDAPKGTARGSIFYQGVPQNSTGSPAYSYEAAWLKDGLLYRLTLGSYSESNIIKYKNMFVQIISTLTFTPDTTNQQ